MLKILITVVLFCVILFCLLLMLAGLGGCGHHAYVKSVKIGDVVVNEFFELTKGEHGSEKN